MHEFYPFSLKKVKSIFNSVVILLILLVSGCIQKTDTPFIISGGSSYVQNGGSASKSSQVYSASLTDESGVKVYNGGKLVLSSSSITTTGNSSLQSNSNYYGLNAAVLALTGSKITLNESVIKTTGKGAIGAYSGDSVTIVLLSNDSIITTNFGAVGVDAASGGTLTLTDVSINTRGSHAPAISTDRGGGNVNVLRGTATTYGSNSPGIYSIGYVSVTDGQITANGSEGAIIEGTGSAFIWNTNLTCSKGLRNCGFLLYQSNSGAAIGFRGMLSIAGGSLNWLSADGPLFYVTNTNGSITLSGVTINSNSPLLVKAGSDVWNTAGSFGAGVILTAITQVLSGNIVADTSSYITTVLKDNAILNGSVNPDNTAKSANFYMLASTSSWSLNANSYLTILSDSIGISGTSINNINGNGYNVYYDTTYTENHLFGKSSYSLVNGGWLLPKPQGK